MGDVLGVVAGCRASGYGGDGGGRERVQALGECGC